MKLASVGVVFSATLLCSLCTLCNSSDMFSSLSGIKETLEFIKAVPIHRVFQRRFIRPHQARIRHLQKVSRLAHTLQELRTKYDFNKSHQLPILKYIQRYHDLKMATVKAIEVTSNRAAEKYDNWSLRNYLSRLPEASDLDGSALGWVRLHYIYRLSLQDMYNGTVDGFTSSALTTAEVIDAVNVTINSSKEMNANMFNLTLNMLDVLNETRHAYMSVEDETNLLLVVCNIYNRAACYCSLPYQNALRQLNAINPDVAKGKLPRSRCRAIETTNACRMALRTWTTDPLEQRFYNVCRGDVQDTHAFARDYVTSPRDRVCLNVHNNQPYLLLQPIKVEILNWRGPHVAIYHDIVEEREIDYIKENSINRLVRGRVTTLRGQLPSTNKITKQTLLSFKMADDNLSALQARLYGVTLLHKRSFERIQVANYGVGGTYKMHVDFLHPGVWKNFTEFTDRRLCTILAYMTDVESGGSTVFPYLDIAARPKKGNALVFYNLFKNGTGNFLATHASCPIKYGDKWIANQWVLCHGQEFAYPCTTLME